MISLLYVALIVFSVPCVGTTRRHVETIAGLESRPTRSLLCVSSRSVCDHRYCSTCALFVSKSSLRSLSAPLSASIRLLAALADAVPGG